MSHCCIVCSRVSRCRCVPPTRLGSHGHSVRTTELAQPTRFTRRVVAVQVGQPRAWPSTCKHSWTHGARSNAPSWPVHSHESDKTRCTHSRAAQLRQVRIPQTRQVHQSSYYTCHLTVCTFCATCKKVDATNPARCYRTSSYSVPCHAHVKRGRRHTPPVAARAAKKRGTGRL